MYREDFLDDEGEEWESIPGFPNYMISNFGNVWTFNENRLLKPFPDKNGYQIVSLRENGKRVDFKIHRLVADAFLSHRSGTTEVNHDDGDKSYNYVDNLEWVTHIENMEHAMNNGLSIRRSVRIIETGEVFKSLTSCARALNSRPAHIHNCVSGRRKRHKGFTFQYVD